MKTGIYTRVSLDRQAQEGFSLQAQYDQLMKFVDLQGWDLVRVYTDPGVSAKDLNRPGVQEMIEDLKAGKFQAVIVHKLDRLTRNISDLYDLVELVNKRNVKLISLSENIDTSTPMGRMFIYLLGIFAQMFRENLSEEVKKGMLARAEEGLRNTFAPYGYEMDEGGKLVIVPDQAELIRRVFNLLISKKWGYTTIAKHLNIDDKSGLRGGKFYSSSIETILKNYTYIGKNHWKRKDAPESERTIEDGGHEPIIDEDTFERAQTIITRRANKEMSRSHYDYPYSTIMRCGKCGGPYHGMMMKHHGPKYYYYRCFNKLHGKCDQSDLSELKFEKLFFNQFNIPVEDVSFQEAAPAKDDSEKERKQLERELAKSEQRRKNWQYAFGDGKIPYEDYVKLIDEEMQRVHDLKTQLESIPLQQSSVITKSDVYQTIQQIQKSWPLLERVVKKDFINMLFKGIYILKEDGKWRITRVDWV